jgi:hypothetical protein
MTSAVGNRYQVTATEECNGLRRTSVSYNDLWMCRMVIALLLLVVTSCKSSINPNKN